MKKIISILTAAIMLFGTAYAGSLSEKYPEIKDEFPTLTGRLNNGGASDEDIVTFLDDIEEYILKSGEKVTEQNFDDIMTAAVTQVLKYKSNLPVYNALTKEFTGEALSYAMTGKIPQSLMPFYEAVKKAVLLADLETYALFTDENDYAWALEAIKTLTKSGIISGYADGTFLGNNNITRAEFTKIAVLAFGLYDEDADCNFADVSGNDWFYPYVASAAKYGVINGYEDATFRPDDCITRQDIALIVYNARYNGEEGDAQFADSSDIAPYAAEAVGAMKTLGIINGVGGDMFLPRSFATRAQCAQIVYNAI